MLYRAAKYLRDQHGRTDTEAARRILTTAARFIGTEDEVDLNHRYIRGGYPEGSPAKISEHLKEKP